MTQISEIQNIITELQDSGKEAFGSAGYAWSSGFLGSILADALYYHIPANHRDIILQSMVSFTERNRKISEEKVA